jgi:xanthine dehydrogenase large subunit
LFKLSLNQPKLDNLQEYILPDENPDEEIIFADGQVRFHESSIALTKLIRKAYLNRISLGGYAHFKTEQLGFCKESVQGRAFNYYTQGLAISEVEIDCYTGDLKVLRSDLLMDLGRPINPGIDRGQVIGGFIQGMGWVTTEALSYNQERALVSHSPTTYKIPNVQDIPRILKVDLIENLDNTVNLHRSKAVGEPPLLLGISVWTAVKNALSYRGKGANLTSPATSEEILRELTGEFECSQPLLASAKLS